MDRNQFVCLAMSIAALHGLAACCPGQNNSSLPALIETHASVEPVPRSSDAWKLQALEQSVRDLSAEGFSLAVRGAHYSARSKFIHGLRILAEGLDAERGIDAHSRSLDEAFRAIKEADDFATRPGRSDARPQVSWIVKSHRTPALAHEDVTHMSSFVAMQRYYAFAQQKMLEATGKMPFAAESLYNLGKLHAHRDAQQGTSGLGLAKAIAFYQTALAVQPQHHLAANELGVLLARVGQLPEAKRALQQSLVVKANANTWRNLAIVHERLQEPELAELARSEMKLLEQTPAAKALARQRGAKPSILWVSPETFARAGGDSPRVSHSIPAESARHRPHGPSGPQRGPIR